VMVGTTITCIGKEIERKGRLVIMRGEILNPDGALAAEAEAKMMWGA
jgi:acyl dehydratase